MCIYYILLHTIILLYTEFRSNAYYETCESMPNIYFLKRSNSKPSPLPGLPRRPGSGLALQIFSKVSDDLRRQQGAISWDGLTANDYHGNSHKAGIISYIFSFHGIISSQSFTKQVTQCHSVPLCRVLSQEFPGTRD